MNHLSELRAQQHFTVRTDHIHPRRTRHEVSGCDNASVGSDESACKQELSTRRIVRANLHNALICPGDDCFYCQRSWRLSE
jgi:hypothetical protein